MLARSRRIQQQWSFLHALYRLADGVCLLGATALTLYLTGFFSGERLMVITAAVIVVYRLVAELSGMYRSWRGVPVERELSCVLLTWLYALPLLTGLAYFTGYAQDLSINAVVCWAIISPCLLCLTRMHTRWFQQFLRAKGLNRRGFAIVGANDLGIQLARNIEASPEMGLRLTGFYDDRPDGRTTPLPKDVGAKVGDLDALVAAARARQVDMIYITFPMRAESRIKSVLEKLGDTTASVYIVPDFFVFELLHSRWTNINGLPVVSVFENPLYGVDGLLKRASDVVLSAALLLLLAIPLLAIAAAVKLTSPGPVFFRQKRYGLDGREILVWKFRSMRVCENGASVTQATKDDERITKVGRFLRRTSLDELPQLFNVLEGSMSLVGPRPHANAHNEAYRKEIKGYMLRHKVKPGITGLAQVNGWRGETETLDKMEKRIECDHQYIREWSLWMDVKILFKTIGVVLKGENAY
ncbi:MAG: undecaprenyl-phosphate glucose phosphotransferase [Pirellulales bacterium]